MNQKRYYANAMKLLYIFRHKKRRRGILSRTNKAYALMYTRYGHEGWLEFVRNNK